MLNMLSPTLFATIVIAFFIIVQLYALLAAQNNLALADGQCGFDLGDLDPRPSTAPDDQQNTTYLEHALAERDLQNVRGFLSSFIFNRIVLTALFWSSSLAGMQSTQRPAMSMSIKSFLRDQVFRGQIPKNQPM
jgi:hypothetical protein